MKSNAWLLLMPLLAFGLCYHFSFKMHCETITAQELRNEVSKYLGVDHSLYLDSKSRCCNPNKNLVVMNITRNYGTQKFHITGAFSVRYVDLIATTQQWDRQKKIIVYCDELDPELALQAGRVLTGKGFCNVKVYKGGMRDWFSYKYPVCTQPSHSLALM